MQNDAHCKIVCAYSFKKALAHRIELLLVIITGNCDNCLCFQFIRGFRKHGDGVEEFKTS